MSKVAHIYIYGDIYNEQSDWAADYGIVSMSSVVKQIQANPDAEELYVHIHSRGGDVNEGFAIYDLLTNSGKTITTHIEGLCASIATVIFLAGSKRLMNKNSEFFIHNPWGDPYQMNGFTADDYEKRAEEIRVAEDKLKNFYQEKTGIDLETLSSMMSEQTTLDASQALEMKFITEIVEVVNAMASLGNNSNKKIMDELQKSKDELKKTQGLVARLKAFLTGDEKALETKALKYTLKDGSEIETDSESEIAVGQSVTANGEAIADGDHTLSDDRIFSTAGGKITELKPADANESNAAALQAQVDDLTAKLNAATEQNATLNKSVEDLSKQVAEVVALAKKTTSNFKPEGREFESKEKRKEMTVSEIVAEQKAERLKAKQTA